MRDYVVESGASSRARARRRRAAITLLAVLLLLFGAFWYAYSYYRHPPPTATPTTTCTTAKPPAKVTVNVYNATGRDGLAASIAQELRSRGFVIGKVSNDPLSQKIKETAEVRYGRAGATLSARVVSLVSKPTKVLDKRKDVSIDLVLGSAFRSLTAAPKATATTSCR